jgi:hypothetical protein
MVYEPEKPASATPASPRANAGSAMTQDLGQEARMRESLSQIHHDEHPNESHGFERPDLPPDQQTVVNWVRLCAEGRIVKVRRGCEALGLKADHLARSLKMMRTAPAAVSSKSTSALSLTTNSLLIFFLVNFLSGIQAHINNTAHRFAKIYLFLGGVLSDPAVRGCSKE